MSSHPILVTGASRGIGRAVAESLAGAGHDLVLWGRSGVELLEVAERAPRNDSVVRTQVVDVTSAQSIRTAVDDLADRYEAMAGLVLNAGFGQWASVIDTTEDVWDRTIATNLTGAFHTVRAVLPLLAGGARLVALSSDSASTAYEDRAAYCASKAGLVAMLECLRLELPPDKVNITIISPGRVATHFGGKRPADRPGALDPLTIGNVVRQVFELPPEVELREFALSSTHDSYAGRARKKPGGTPQ